MKTAVRRVGIIGYDPHHGALVNDIILVGYLNPLRYFMEIVRGVFLKGVGVDILWPKMLALAVYGVLVLGLSALHFRKTLN